MTLMSEELQTKMGSWTEANIRDIESFSKSSGKFYDNFGAELEKQHLDFESTVKVCFGNSFLETLLQWPRPK